VRGAFGQRFDDGAHVADVHALFQQVLQHALQRGQGSSLGTTSSTSLGELGGMIDQAAAPRCGRAAPGRGSADLSKVRGDHGGGIDHGVAQACACSRRPCVDPHGRQAEGRVARRFVPWQYPGHAPRIDRHQAARVRLAAAHIDALEGDAVAVRLEFEVVADVHRRR
jgi:hypothetical protein